MVFFDFFFDDESRSTEQVTRDPQAVMGLSAQSLQSLSTASSISKNVPYQTINLLAVLNLKLVAWLLVHRGEL